MKTTVVLVHGRSTIEMIGLQNAVESLNGFKVSGTAQSVPTAQQRIHQCRPNIILLSLSFGLENIIRLVRQFGEEAVTPPAVVWGNFENPRVATQLLRAGVKVLIHHASDRVLLNHCLSTVLQGRSSWVDPREFHRLLVGQFNFSQRQKEIIRLILGGLSNNREIARKLGIAEGTVKNHLKGIYNLVGCSSKTELLYMLGGVFENGPEAKALAVSAGAS